MCASSNTQRPACAQPHPTTNNRARIVPLLPTHISSTPAPAPRLALLRPSSNDSGAQHKRAPTPQKGPVTEAEGRGGVKTRDAREHRAPAHDWELCRGDTRWACRLEDRTRKRMRRRRRSLIGSRGGTRSECCADPLLVMNMPIDRPKLSVCYAFCKLLLPCIASTSSILSTTLI